MDFTDLGLSPETLKAITEVGYSTPTPIQEQAIPWVLMGRDVMGIAQTGTGKTASFTLPMIDILANGRAKARMPRSLILAPTRELANQAAENFILYGKYHRLSMALLIGGESFTEQEKALDRGVDVLVATPGRLMDLFDRGRIILRDVKVLVIDEADRMLDMGFIPDVERIVSLLPPLRQTLFFSATMDDQIRRLANAFLSNPKEVRVARQATAAETVTQKMLVVSPSGKREALRRILRQEKVRNAFIFCNRKRDVTILHRSLTKHGFDSAQLHGDMAQSERTATLAAFKAGEIRLMVCSDVAARGIDIADVSHVFNFDVPYHAEDYIHRIGRTGRAGRDGVAWSIATEDDAKLVTAIEKLTGKQIPRVTLGGMETTTIVEEATKDSPDPVHKPREERAENPQRLERARDDRPRSNRRHEGYGRDRNHPANEVAEMMFADNAVAFGGVTPAFLLAPLTRSEENVLRMASGLAPLPSSFSAEESGEEYTAPPTLAEPNPVTGPVESAEQLGLPPQKKARRTRKRSQKPEQSADTAAHDALASGSSPPSRRQPRKISSEISVEETGTDNRGMVADSSEASPNAGTVKPPRRRRTSATSKKVAETITSIPPDAEEAPQHSDKKVKKRRTPARAAKKSQPKEENAK